MEIILTKDVDNLGLAGQVVKVASGYARNYLLPSGSALVAIESNLKALAKKRAEFENRAKEVKEKALDFKNILAKLQLTIARKAGEKDKLYGAVTAQDLIEAAEAQGVSLDRKRLRLAEPIKALGDYDIAIRLHPEIVATFKVKVVAEGQKSETEVAPQPPAQA